MRTTILMLAMLSVGVVACKDDGDDTPPPADDDDATDEPLPYDDADGDGVPDARDHCAGTTAGADTDPRGCSAQQAAECSVTLEAPADGAPAGSGTITFSFDGDCEGYRLYASATPSFPPHRRVLLADMIPAGDVEIDAADLPAAGADGLLYWTVEASGRGHSFLAPPRSVER